MDKIERLVEQTNNINLNTIVTITKPLLKWVGGKTQIINKLLIKYPVSINNYHEIFIGGGSVLFALLCYRNAGLITISGKLYAYDLNKPLIYVYKNIQNKHEQLYTKLAIIINNYKSCDKFKGNRNPTTIDEATDSQESYYYWMRKQYNNLSEDEQCTIYGSSIFIFLNKTCFRGLFRVGPNGYNVPFGHYKNPSIISEEHLLQVHLLIQEVHFIHMDFNESLQNVNDCDFAYLDPPYAPENKTSFVKYIANGFNMEVHEKLFTLCNEMKQRGIRFIMSNSHVEIVRLYFSENDYNIELLICKRSINSKKPFSKTTEVLIKSY
jgi:DNA adenine methylase